jgi:tRNA-guanine family transglycosylase
LFIFKRNDSSVNTIDFKYNLRKIGFFPGKRKAKTNDELYATITDLGVQFKSVYDDSSHFLDAKKSMQIQSNLGADIIMAFDECTSPSQNKKYMKDSMLRSHKWELESIKYKDKKQAIYGIIHGGWFKDLRIQSTKFILSQPFEGIAIGGSLGQTKDEMYKILAWMSPYFDNRPIHMLGIGRVEDIFECVSHGLDTFDCVETTRIARHGNLYVSPRSGGNKNNKFRIEIRKSLYSKDKKPIDKDCTCSTCKKYTRSELHNMLKCKSPEYNRLSTIHNLHFMHNLTKIIRQSIIKGNFTKLKKEWLK